MSRGWPALSVVLALVVFTAVSTRPPFEAGLVALAMLTTAALAPRRDPRDTLAQSRSCRIAFVYAPLVALGAWLSHPAWVAEVPQVGFDGLMNEAIVAEVAHAIERGRPLTWVTRIAPGDPVLDLYPTLPHRVLAHLAVWTGTTAHLDRWLVVALSASWVAAALGIARTALRLGAPAPAAFAAAALALLDPGSDFTWGTHSVFFYGYFPSTVGVAVTLHTLPALFDLARRARRGRWLVSALGVALAAVVHPLALVIALALLCALALGVVVSRGATRRALLAPGAATLAGVAGSAFVWWPLSERVLTHAVHYGTPQIPVELAVARMASGQLPDGGFAALVALAWLTGALAFLRPRALEARVVALVAALLVLSYVDLAFLELGLAPSSATVRWQAFRIGAITKPLLYVLGASGLSSGAELLALVRAPRLRSQVRLVAGTLACVGAMAGPSVWRGDLTRQAAERARDFAGPEQTDPASLAALHGVLAADAEAHPGSRVLLVCEATCAWELFRSVRSAPVSFVLRQPAPAGLLLRDQFATVTPESLRRFGIRWAVLVPDPDAAARGALGRYRAAALGGPPPERDPDLEAGQQVGDRSAERTFGRLRLRPVHDGDATFAHVVSGSGRVHVHTVDGEGFDLELTGTDRPALVEVGTPYYPRLIAHDAAGPVQVHAIPARAPRPDDAAPRIERATALWLRPGMTRLRANGRLPSDGRGALLSATAVGLAGLWLAGARVRRGTRRLVHALDRLELRPAALALGLALAALLVASTWRDPIVSLRFGALLPRPAVFAVSRAGSAACTPSSLGRRFVCPDGAVLSMTIGYGLREWQVGWPVPAPTVALRDADRASRYLIELPGRLEGPYFAHCRGCTATLRDGDALEPLASFSHRTARLALDASTPRLEVRALAREAEITLLAASFLEPDDGGTPPPVRP